VSGPGGAGVLEELDRPLARCMRQARLDSPWRGQPIRLAGCACGGPGFDPRAPGDRVKTDRRDAKRLVRLFAAGELSYAFVPSEVDEHFRDLVRCIEDARKDLMRSRHRLSKFLLRRGTGSPARPGRNRMSSGWETELRGRGL